MRNGSPHNSGCTESILCPRQLYSTLCSGVHAGHFLGRSAYVVDIFTRHADLSAVGCGLAGRASHIGACSAKAQFRGTSRWPLSPSTPRFPWIIGAWESCRPSPSRSSTRSYVHGFVLAGRRATDRAVRRGLVRDPQRRVRPMARCAGTGGRHDAPARAGLFAAPARRAGDRCGRREAAGGRGLAGRTL